LHFHQPTAQKIVLQNETLKKGKEKKRKEKKRKTLFHWHNMSEPE
jgi:hypothetical protein